MLVRSLELGLGIAEFSARLLFGIDHLGGDYGSGRHQRVSTTLAKCDTLPYRCYTSAMPTTKPRYTVTDSGAVSELLDEAQRRWPQIRDRKELLLRLAEAGHEAIERDGAARRAAVAETAGALSGVYEPGELERLREDWPE
jgi:hypothetical protein